MKIAQFFTFLGFVAFIIFSLSIVTGCSSVQGRITDVTDGIRQANDITLEQSEDAYCNGVTDGALSRRYGDSSEIQKARNDLCRLVRSKHYGR